MSLKHKIVGLAALVGLGGTMEAEAQNIQKNTPTKAEIEAVKNSVQFTEPTTYDASADFQVKGGDVLAEEVLQPKEIKTSPASRWVQSTTNMTVEDITRYKFANGDVAIVEEGSIDGIKNQICQITYKKGKEEIKINYADILNCQNNNSALKIDYRTLNDIRYDLKAASDAERKWGEQTDYSKNKLRKAYTTLSKAKMGANIYRENMENNKFLPNITRPGFTDAQLMAYGIKTPGKQTKPDNLQLVNQSTIAR